MTTLQIVGPVARLNLGQAGQANALSDLIVRQLLGDLDQADAAGCTALVLRSLLPQFCAGFDLSGLASTDSSTLAARLLRIGYLLERIQTSSMVTIAVIDGVAIGAGADLAAACDVRIGTERARFRFPGSGFGIVLGTRRLAALVGPGRAMQLAATGLTVDARTALRDGLLTDIVLADDVEDAVSDTVNRIGGRSPQLLASLKSAATGPDPAGLADLARSLARIPDLAGAISAFAATGRPTSEPARRKEAS